MIFNDFHQQIYYDGLYTVPADEKKAIRYFEQAAKLSIASSFSTN